jgi:hypothetical protein
VKTRLQTEILFLLSGLTDNHSTEFSF